MKPCSDFEADLTLHAGAGLPPDDARRLQEHLDHCPACRAGAAELQRLRAKLAGSLTTGPGIELPHDFHQRLVRRVRADAVRRSPPGWLSALAGWLTPSRLAFGVALLTVAITLATLRVHPPVSRTVSTSTKPTLVAAPAHILNEEMSHTVGNLVSYRLALNHSFASLELALAQDDRALDLEGWVKPAWKAGP